MFKFYEEEAYPIANSVLFKKMSHEENTWCRPLFVTQVILIDILNVCSQKLSKSCGPKNEYFEHCID